MPNDEFVPRRGRVSLRWAAALLLGALSALVQAQDVMQPRTAARAITALAATGPRSSPYTPPDKDVFLTDASGGLDTGCTFNSSPLNPLTIDIPIDRFVGDVDANGFLVNPAAAITSGLIPASVDIVLPAFDVDYDGSPPPERDLVVFNGQSLGYLTGADNVWKLNTFRVDIRKIKFPKRPAPQTAPTPVNNRLQISIDTLSVNRWCTQIDWVAIVLPIRPKLALDLEVQAANPMNSDAGVAIKKIQEQTFDANCKVTTTIGAIESYPFSGPSLTTAGGQGNATLKATIKACPEGSLTAPEVKADWSVDGTSKKGKLSWSGLEKEVQFDMPPTIGAYDATLKLMVDGQPLDATRRLYVTAKPSMRPDARINWYKQGTEWAKGESAEPTIVEKVRAGLYGYGGKHWGYHYGFGAKGSKCTWIALMADNPSACNFADCYVFSEVLENVSLTLGVGGMTEETVVGKYPNSFWRFFGSPGEPFLTAAAPSLDPKFPGSARPITGAYDRYIFSSHSLRIRDGKYHDATFNKAYATPTAFITANFNGDVGVDSVGYYRVSEEGPRLYDNFDVVPMPYLRWGHFSYGLAAPLRLAQAPVAPKAVIPAPLLAFPSVSAWRTPDTNGDGRYEAIEADVDVDILSAGRYIVTARLETPAGELVANTPEFQSSLTTQAEFSGGPGRQKITLRFSGEQIRFARSDGPYQLVLYANAASGPAGTARLPTPAFRRADFGERKLQLRSLAPTPIDADGSGKYETVRLTFETDVALAGPYQITASLLGGGSDLANRTRLSMLANGVQTLTIDLPATGIARSGIDGPYDVTISMSDATQATVGSARAVLPGLFASQFEGVVEVGTTPSEQSIDSNGNGLFDLLRIGADVRVRAPRSALVHATLVGANGASVDVDTIAALTTAAQRVFFDFSGPLIRGLQMDSQYRVNLSFRDPATQQEFDAVSLTLRGVYQSARFDPAEAPRAIALTGTLSDRGVDTNGNGLFERLQMDLGVNLLAAGNCEWSARLVDRNGFELGFAANRGVLGAGAQTMRLEFDGRALGTNGLDGPYSVRSVLVACSNGANLVATFAGDTSAWRANQFEGYVVRLPADLNGDGRVDQADVDVFNRALGSSVGDAAYNRFADFDRDGRVTLNDLRLFRAAMRR